MNLWMMLLYPNSKILANMYTPAINELDHCLIIGEIKKVNLQSSIGHQNHLDKLFASVKSGSMIRALCEMPTSIVAIMSTIIQWW
jgi:hypothetical protein